jgi:hypothetical protein
VISFVLIRKGQGGTGARRADHALSRQQEKQPLPDGSSTGTHTGKTW